MWNREISHHRLEETFAFHGTLTYNTTFLLETLRFEKIVAYILLEWMLLKCIAIVGKSYTTSLSSCPVCNHFSLLGLTCQKFTEIVNSGFFLHECPAGSIFSSHNILVDAANFTSWPLISLQDPPWRAHGGDMGPLLSIPPTVPICLSLKLLQWIFQESPRTMERCSTNTRNQM